MIRTLSCIVVFFVACCASAIAQEPVAVKNASSPNDVFKERIMPIFNSPDPSSCVQCHLSSVDLKDYILPSHEKTFVSLRDQGLIDLEQPRSSKILKLIGMGDQDHDPYAKRIHQSLRKAEYEAFAEWIVASCNDEKLVSLPKADDADRSGPAVANEVIRHNRKSRVVNSFVRKVWSQRMRCFPCHTKHEIGPQQKGAKDKFDQWYEEYGDQMLIFKKTPEATMRYLIEQSEKTTETSLPLLNLEQPDKSLLVLKPMSKIPPKEGDRRVPTYREPVYHIGGLKIHKNDHSHKAFISWIEDYAAVSEGAYKSPEDLPDDNWLITQRILRMKEVPESWKTGTTFQMTVHAQTDSGEWTEAIGFTQGTVTPKRIVNGAMILLSPTDDKQFKAWRLRKNKLPPGNYLVKIYADTESELEENPTMMLGEKRLIGEVQIEEARWRAGFPKAEWISAKDF
ncbi:MAG: hypothetical protein AAFN77_00540 [Planctomycetota bacterium]